MNKPAISARNHCLAPARVRAAIEAPLARANYCRMFPELSSFKADGHHVLRIYCKNLVGRMYEKFSTFLRSRSV